MENIACNFSASFTPSWPPGAPVTGEAAGCLLALNSQVSLNVSFQTSPTATTIINSKVGYVCSLCLKFPKVLHSLLHLKLTAIL